MPVVALGLLAAVVYLALREAGRPSLPGGGGGAGGGARVSPHKRIEPALPWGVFSEATRAYQNEINEALDFFEYERIEANGILDATTCGAAGMLAVQHGRKDLQPQARGADCRRYGPGPKKIPGAAGPPPGEPTPSTECAAAREQLHTLEGRIADLEAQRDSALAAGDFETGTQLMAAVGVLYAQRGELQAMVARICGG